MSSARELLLAARPPTENIPDGLNSEGNDELKGPDFIARCLGQGRLLGGDLGQALAQIVPGLQGRQELVTDLAVLTRSHVVLTDALDDRSWIESSKIFLEQWRAGVKTEILQIMSALDMPASLFDQHEAISRQAYEDFNFSQPLKSVRYKLEVFFLSLKIPELVDHPAISTLIEDLVGHYLFALQLIDDLADIPEDYCAPKNHNLYVGQSTAADYQAIFSHRQNILAELTAYLDISLSRFHEQPLFAGTVFDDYLKGMSYWITHQHTQTHATSIEKLLPSRFEHHSLPLSVPTAWKDHSAYPDASPLPPDVSAPAAHRRIQCFGEAEDENLFSSR